MLVASVAGLADPSSPIAEAATDAGALILREPTLNGGGAVLTTGGSATPFVLTFGSAATQSPAFCTGYTATGGYQVQTYMVPASVAPDSLTFDSSGPTPSGLGANFRQPLYSDAGQTPLVNLNTAQATAAGGQIVGLQTVSLGAFFPGDIPPGTYNVGVMCTRTQSGATTLDRYWNTTLSVVTSQSDSPAQITWTAGSASTSTTTTVAGGGGGATTTTTTIGGGGGATTTSTTVAGGGGTATTSTTVAAATTTTVPGTRSVSTPGGTVNLSASGGTLTAFTAASVTTPPPAGITMPFGQFTFSATTTAGGIVTFTMTTPTAATAYYKFLNNVWANFTFDGETGAQVSGNTITIRIKDNGRGDSNTASGQVTDPGAPAVSQTNVTTTIAPGGGTSGSGVSNPGGSLVATGSSPWSIVMWAILLLAFGRTAMLLAKPPRVLPPR